MNRGVISSAGLAVSLFLGSCTLDTNWRYDQQSGLGPKERLISVKFDPQPNLRNQDERFQLYFFTKKPFDKNMPTVLFCAGGPGQVVGPEEEGFLDYLQDDYNIVYFQLRGSGYSQFPPLNSYDRYLRTRFAVEDIEAIRTELNIDHWEAIVGYSYGSILAQQYTGTYKERVGKLVLVAPESRRQIRLARDANQLEKKMNRKHTDNLKEIFNNKSIELNGHEFTILGEADNVFDQVEREFGGLQFVIDEYDQLKAWHGRDLLKEHDLDYSKAFFIALRKLRMIGWLPEIGPAKREQERTAIIIARELWCKMQRFPSGKAQIETKAPREQIPKHAEGIPAISYCDALDAVNKLTLKLSSLSWNDPAFSKDADKFNKHLRDKQLQILENIYETEFKSLDIPRKVILEKVNTILAKVQYDFGGLWFVIDKYDDLNPVAGGLPITMPPPQNPFAFGSNSPPQKTKLQVRSLPYSLEFFKALQSLLYITTPSLQSESEMKWQRRIVGAVIIYELAKEVKQLNGFSGRDIVIESETISHNDAKQGINEFRFDVPSQWAKDTTAKQVKNLTLLFNNGSYDLRDYRGIILEEAKRIIELVEENFDSCWDCLSEKNRERSRLASELTELNLDYPDTSIFRLLQSLIYINDGTLQEAPDPRKQAYVGAVIGRTIACEKADRIEKWTGFSSVMPAIKEDNISHCAILNLIKDEDKSSGRVFNVVSAYDGINVGFLDAWLSEAQNDIRKALRKSAGELHFDRCGILSRSIRCPNAINPYVENVGITDEEIKPWDPDDFAHKVPTLILKGSADPVTAGDQPEEFFTTALMGPRILMIFPGIGHNMDLPEVRTLDIPMESSGPCVGSDAVSPGEFVHSARNCLIGSYLQMDFEHFKQARILREIENVFKGILGPRCLNDCVQIREQEGQIKSEKKD